MMPDFVWDFLSYDLGLNHCQWYRRWRGGHWEHCWVDPCRRAFWMPLDHEETAASPLRIYGTIERLIECETWAGATPKDAEATQV